MRSIYKSDNIALHDLLSQVASGSNPNLVIPALQRDYIWEPNQVVLLIDSLLRGWPFGTFLLWEIPKDTKFIIPFRTLYNTIDRTESANNSPLSKTVSPAAYRMILDGQQRIQSLIIAFGNEDAGFLLYDSVWSEQVTKKKKKGRKSDHSSYGSLYFSLADYLDLYTQKKDASVIDYTQVLNWITPENINLLTQKAIYEPPLDVYNNNQNTKGHIRLSRLWNEAPLGHKTWNTLQQIARRIIISNLPSSFNKEHNITALAEFISLLSEMKHTNVTYLQLNSYNNQENGEEESESKNAYSNSIVSIFTRLNTAGRALNREDVIFAWIKVHWVVSNTNGRDASQCYSDLREIARQYNVSCTIEDLVKSTAFLWSCTFGKGQILNDSDLLAGNNLERVSHNISESWDKIKESLEQTLVLLENRDLNYGNNLQYTSLNALNTLWCVTFITNLGIESNKPRKRKVPQLNNIKNQSQRKYEYMVDRWIIGSTWAGLWSAASGQTLKDIAEILYEYYRSALDKADDEIMNGLDNCIESLMAKVSDDAVEYIDQLSANRREKVSKYYLPLWVWHRLNEKRWEQSKVQLQTGSRKTRTEVDHVISAETWACICENNKLTDDATRNIINSIGNTALLEKTFNISKGKEPMKNFLLQIDYFKQEENITIWRDSLALSEEIIACAEKEKERQVIRKITEAIGSRAEKIKKELKEFINGQQSRKDIVTQRK